MAKDPAMLWYWSDWHSGTSLLTRFLKGCYMDLLHAQFNNGPLSLEEIKICLGSDFGIAWPALQKKFKSNPDGLFYNERTEREKEKRANFCESRRKNKENKTYDTTYDEHMINHMENKNENKDQTKKVSKILKPPDYVLIFTIEHCLNVAMLDPRWVSANKTSQKELLEFNGLLEKRGVYEKNPLDYKTHFSNWKHSGKKDEILTEKTNGTIKNREKKAWDIIGK